MWFLAYVVFAIVVSIGVGALCGGAIGLACKVLLR
jgi:hypothetical protein